jgi:Flavin containing amine oxidoreductase
VRGSPVGICSRARPSSRARPAGSGAHVGAGSSSRGRSPYCDRRRWHQRPRGLAAALRLQDSGLASTLYEANTRIGGRMFSNSTTWASGQVSEWGGELIDTGHKVVQGLAKRFNIALDNLVQAEPSSAEPTYFFAGAFYPYAQATKDFQVVHQAISADMQTFTWPVLWNSNTPGGVVLSNLSVYDWIETRVPGGHGSNMGKLLDVDCNIEYGGESRDQTSLNLLAYQPSPGQFSIFGLSDEPYHMHGGNQLLPKAIAAALPASSINTGWVLTTLAKNVDDTQTLTFSVGGQTRTIVADHRSWPSRWGSSRLSASPRRSSTRARPLRSPTCGWDATTSCSYSSPAGCGTGPARGRVCQAGSRTPTPASRTRGRYPGRSRGPKASWSTTPVATWPARSPPAARFPTSPALRSACTPRSS